MPLTVLITDHMNLGNVEIELLDMCRASEERKWLEGDFETWYATEDSVRELGSIPYDNIFRHQLPLSRFGSQSTNLGPKAGYLFQTGGHGPSNHRIPCQHQDQRSRNNNANHPNPFFPIDESRLTTTSTVAILSAALQRTGSASHNQRYHKQN